MPINRRRLLGDALKIAAAVTAAGPLAAARPARVGTSRGADAYKRRVKAAEQIRDAAPVEHVTNGDAALGRWAIYSKGLPHDAATGEADRAALQILRDGIASGSHASLEKVPLGGYVKLADPQAAFAFDLIGPDSRQIAVPAPPPFSSAEQAAEMVEMYWHALLRDVAFDDYEQNPIAARAALELTQLPGYKGPRDESGTVTPALLFRGTSRGGRTGPYLSQFLVRDLPWTPIRVPQKIRTAIAKHDYVMDEQSWLALQNGAISEDTKFAEKPTYVRTGRDLAEFVHRDFTYQLCLGACLMLLKMSAPVDGGIPYHYSISQSGFVTFGPSDVLHLVASVANVALKAAWYQKWCLHMRLRPEEYGGRVQKHLKGTARYPLHVDLLNSAALEQTRSRFSTGLLPQAYPEGSPTHPSYIGGHAVIAGACVTALKAFFNETWVMPGSVLPAADGQSLKPYKELQLTVGQELDKLAENVAYGRDFAGIHWRSDEEAGLRLGEEVAIHMLRETRMTSHEIFDGFQLTRMDGTSITIR